MSHRTTLYAPDLRKPTAGQRVLIPTEEVRHVHAARLRPGAEVRLTNGDGRLWSARLDSMDRDQARCVLVDELSAPADLDVELAFGIGSKPRTLWLVEKAVELGVAVLRPIEFKRSRSVTDGARSAAFWEKARRRAVAALTQCGGARLPAIETPQALGDYLAGQESPREGIRLALDMDGDRPMLATLAEGRGEGEPVLLLIGPEGGMAPEERTACRAAGYRFATLGDRVLRFETAALVALALAGLVADTGSTLGRAEGAEAGRKAEAAS